MTDPIIKSINIKYLEQIIQDNILSGDFDKLQYNQLLLDDDIRKELVDIIYTTYHEFSKISNKFNKTEYFNYFNNLIKIKLESRILCNEPKYSKLEIEKLSNHIEELKLIPQPEQRTPEWYIFRENRLTASDLGTAIGKNPYSSLDKLLLKKCGHEEPFKPGAAIIHGVKYEDVAISIYSSRNKVNVFEFGCLPHSVIPYFGASPDGICDKESLNKDYIGRMLEIKCPTSRPITGFPPKYYYAQVQGQLEVCDLEYCDFLECKIAEYNNMDEYLKDGDLFRSNGLEKGVLIELYNIENKKSEYIYGNLGMSVKDISIWEDKIVTSVLNSNKHEYVGTIFWKLEEYLCTLIKRDKKWFSEAKILIDEFWNKVLYYRKNGINGLLKDKKVKKKNNDVGKLTKKEVSKYIFLSDSD